MHMQIRICKLHEEKLIFTQQRNLFPVRPIKRAGQKKYFNLKTKVEKKVLKKFSVM
jgi:hypothetical protein